MMQTPEKPKCAAKVKPLQTRTGWVAASVCGKRASVQRDGVWYCKTHDPVRVAERAAKRDAEYNARLQAEINEEERAQRIQTARDKVIEAATVYVQKYNNVRTVSNKEWAEEVRTAFMRLEDALRELEEARKLGILPGEE